MSDTLVAPENEIFPNRKRWPRRECEKIEKAGVLPERYELIDGAILSKMGHKPLHCVTLNRIFQWLYLAFGGDFLRNQQPITVEGRTELFNDPLPDLVVTTGRNEDYGTRNPAPSELVLLIEISDSTLRMDRTMKALLYAKSGVREYWVANIAKREIIRHRKPKRAGYAEVTTLGADEIISPESRPDDSIRVGDLFPPLSVKPE